jgi:hypothetical protein
MKQYLTRAACRLLQRACARFTLCAAAVLRSWARSQPPARRALVSASHSPANARLQSTRACVPTRQRAARQRLCALRPPAPVRAPPERPPWRKERDGAGWIRMEVRQEMPPVEDKESPGRRKTEEKGEWNSPRTYT